MIQRLRTIAKVMYPKLTDMVEVGVDGVVDIYAPEDDCSDGFLVECKYGPDRWIPAANVAEVIHGDKSSLSKDDIAKMLVPDEWEAAAKLEGLTVQASLDARRLPEPDYKRQYMAEFVEEAEKERPPDPGPGPGPYDVGEPYPPVSKSTTKRQAALKAKRKK